MYSTYIVQVLHMLVVDRRELKVAGHHTAVVTTEGMHQVAADTLLEVVDNTLHPDQVELHNSAQEAEAVWRLHLQIPNL